MIMLRSALFNAVFFVTTFLYTLRGDGRAPDQPASRA